MSVFRKNYLKQVLFKLQELRDSHFEMFKFNRPLKFEAVGILRGANRYIK